MSRDDTSNTTATSPTTRFATQGSETESTSDQLLGWPSSRWLIAGYLALVALHLWFSKDITGPTVTPDEIGYLGNARFIAGFRPSMEMVTGPVYAWGYSLVIVPLAWLFGDHPYALFRAVQVLNAFLMAAIFPLSAVFLQKVTGFSRQSALLGAMVGALYSATLVMSGSAWAENLLAPLTILWTISIWWALSEEGRPDWQRLAVVPITVWLHAAHPRYLVLLGLTIIGFIIAGATRLVGRRLAALGVGSLLAGWLASRMVTAWIAAARWPGIVVDKGSSGRLMRRLITPSYVPKTGAGMVGQGWYLAAGTFGLAAAGALVFLWLAWGKSASLDKRRRLTIGATGVVLFALFTTSVLSFVSNNPRVDTLIYGRYNESFTPLLVALGMAALLAAKPAERRLLVIATVAVLLVLSLLLAIARGPRLFAGEIIWNNILAVYAQTQLFGTTLALGGATVLAVALFILASAFVVRRNPHLAAAAFGGIFIAFGFAALQPIESFAHSLYDDWRFVPELERVVEVAEVDVIGLDTTNLARQAQYSYTYWMPNILFSARVTGVEKAFDPDLMVAKPDVPPLEANGGADEWAGAAVVALDGRANQAVWVKPGRVYDRLAAAGAILPPNWQSERPGLNMRSSIEFLGEAPPAAVREWDNMLMQPPVGTCNETKTSTEVLPVIEVVSGASTAICVRVTNSDSRYAWPTDSTWPALGVIRVGERWFPPDAGSTGTAAGSSGDSFFEAPYRIPLPHYMWAGDSTVLSVAIHAIDSQGAALPAGEYRVGVDVLQEGFLWFSEPGEEPLGVSVIVKPAN